MVTAGALGLRFTPRALRPLGLTLLAASIYAAIACCWPLSILSLGTKTVFHGGGIAKQGQKMTRKKETSAQESGREHFSFGYIHVPAG